VKKLILCGLLALLTAGESTAGPIRNAVQRIRGGGCGGGCQPATTVQPAPVQYAQPAYQPAPPPVVMPATGQTVHLVSHRTSYEPPVVAGGGVAAYQPIRLGSPVPTTCAGGVCR
jgi:hypothetical protein